MLSTTDGLNSHIIENLIHFCLSLHAFFNTFSHKSPAEDTFVGTCFCPFPPPTSACTPSVANHARTDILSHPQRWPPPHPLSFHNFMHDKLLLNSTALRAKNNGMKVKKAVDPLVLRHIQLDLGMIRKQEP
jgi:hypothetical protein